MQSLSLNSDVQNHPKNKCLKCGLVNFANEASCKRCGNYFSNESATSTETKQFHAQSAPPSFINYQPATNSNTTISFELTPRLLLGVVGSIVLFVGVFMPLFSMPIVGNVNYFQNGKGDGVVIIILAGISLFLVLTDRFRGLLITGILSLAMMCFTFFSFQWKMSQTHSEMSQSDNPFIKGLGEKMLETVQLQWGWAILVIGAGMLIAAALIKSNHNENDEFVTERDNKSLYVVLAVAGIALTVWICLAAFPKFSDGSNSLFGGSPKDTAAKEKADSEANLAKQRQPLLNALSVSITGKEFSAADFYAGRPSDYVSFNIQQMNKSAKDIRAFKGIFEIKDIFGDEIIKIRFRSGDISDDILRAGQSTNGTVSLDYNQFMDSHQKLRSTAIENLRIEWQPEMIMFSDGTALNINGEQSYSIENDIPNNQTETAELPPTDIPNYPTKSNNFADKQATNYDTEREFKYDEFPTESPATEDNVFMDSEPSTQMSIQNKSTTANDFENDGGYILIPAPKDTKTPTPTPKTTKENNGRIYLIPKDTETPTPTPKTTEEKNQMKIEMPDGRIRLVNQ